MKEIHVIYNPVSGRGTIKQQVDKLKEWAQTQTDLNLVVHETENVGHATAIARDLSSAKKPVTILVMGGDGSVNEVLNGIEDFENTTIGILPFGSGNDFFKSLGIKNLDIIYLINQYANNTYVRKVDHLLINNKYRCMNATGLGMSSEVVAYRDSMKHFKPATQYKIATIVRTLAWKTIKFKFSYDGKPVNDVKTVWFCMTNGSYVGGGLVVAKEAKIDDGEMTVSCVRKFCRLNTLNVLTKVKLGKIAKVKKRSVFNCKEINIDGENLNLEYDGFIIKGLNHINVKLVPGKVRLLSVKEGK